MSDFSKLKNPNQQAAVESMLKKIAPLREEMEAILSTDNSSPVDIDQYQDKPSANLEKSELLQLIESIKNRLQVISNVFVLENEFTIYHEEMLNDLKSAVDQAYERLKHITK